METSTESQWKMLFEASCESWDFSDLLGFEKMNQTWQVGEPIEVGELANLDSFPAMIIHSWHESPSFSEHFCWTPVGYKISPQE